MTPAPDPQVAPRVVLGVAGGIAAYKACELLRLFTESGHRVRVVPTEAALRFVGEATWAALSGQPVAANVWADAHEVPHVRIGRSAQLVVVAPATADLLARTANGIADDLLTNLLLTARCPVVMAPAMHTEMWEHPATQTNVATLRARGVIVLDPAEGRLTGADTGKGRLPEPGEIFAVCLRVLRRGSAADGTLAGRHVVVTAGGTREPLDPVRFLGNRSSGKQGYAFARTAVARGARVTLVSANVALPEPAGVTLVRVGTTEELRKATLEAAEGADVVVMAAAPADYRPAEYAPQKIKKSATGKAPVLRLAVNPDIAAELGERKRPGQVLVAFAAETSEPAGSGGTGSEPAGSGGAGSEPAGSGGTGSEPAGSGGTGSEPAGSGGTSPEPAGSGGGVGGPALAYARSKLVTKRADLIVVNEVGPDRVFGQEGNAVTVLGADGSTVELSQRPKEDVADAVWDLVIARLPKS